MKTRLSPNEVAEIRYRFSQGWRPEELAREYYRSRSHIYKILAMKAWPRHIPYQFPLPLEER